MRKVRVGLAGLGTVGYGTYAVLNENAQVISSRSGVGIEVACAVVRNVAKAKEKTGDKLPIQTGREDAKQTSRTPSGKASRVP